MALRRHKRDSSASVVFIIILLGLVFSSEQNQHSLSVLLLILLATMLCISAFALFIRARRLKMIERSNIEDVDIMSGQEFELYIELLLKKSGYKNVRRIKIVDDLGIDIIGEKDGEVWGVQVKRYKGAVGLNAVRQAVATLPYYKCTKAMVITNSYFTVNAQKIARSAGCVLIDRDILMKLLLKKHLQIS